MNNAIYLTLKKLNNPESVSDSEIKNAVASANAACIAAADVAYDTDYSVYDSSGAAYALYAVLNAATDRPEVAKHRISEYFELTGENKQDYINAIEEEK